jgi:hypothetical protein
MWAIQKDIGAFQIALKIWIRRSIFVQQGEACASPILHELLDLTADGEAAAAGVPLRRRVVRSI